ncbi:MAG: OB-fold putative lipoprotein [Treponema sp.]|jgi:hypothetical protein|nr:OB-fold putative lipoprotein [Treponema sp.]
MNKKIIIMIIVCVAVFWGTNITSCATSKNNFSGETTVNTEISAEELMDEFLKNEAIAQQKYSDTRITLTGIIFEKATPKDNVPKKDRNYIVFGNYNETKIGVQCYFDEFMYTSVNVGETITVEGNYRKVEYAGDVFKMIVLGESKIIKE